MIHVCGVVAESGQNRPDPARYRPDPARRTTLDGSWVVGGSVPPPPKPEVCGVPVPAPSSGSGSEDFFSFFFLHKIINLPTNIGAKSAQNVI